MQDDNFAENFQWYEWSFVSPAEVPASEPRARVERDVPDVAYVSPATRTRERRDEDWKWTR